MAPLLPQGIVATTMVALLIVLMTQVVLMPPGPGPSAQAAAPSAQLPEGMDRETVAAIDKGLKYLASTQRRSDGSWTVRGQYGRYATVMTSMAAMGLLANGSTPETGPYAKNVTKAMNYVLRQARSEDGLIAAAGSGRSMYGHGFSMLFLAQCYGVEINVEHEKRLHGVLTKAVDLTVRAQSDLGKRLKHAGGWYYTPEARSDEGSVTVTQLQALRACRNVGITVPKSSIDRAVAYLRYCQMPDGGICYSANSRGSGRPPISAAALACFYAAGVYDRQAGGKGAEAKMVERLWKYVKPHMDPGTGFGGTWDHYFYKHFYYAQALYQRGGKEWLAYYKKMQQALRNSQNIDGSWSGGVGTPYRTGIACIILQLPYGYLPICQR